jgi:hypothetical protein
MACRLPHSGLVVRAIAPRGRGEVGELLPMWVGSATVRLLRPSHSVASAQSRRFKVGLGDRNHEGNLEDVVDDRECLAFSGGGGWCWSWPGKHASELNLNLNFNFKLKIPAQIAPRSRTAVNGNGPVARVCGVSQSSSAKLISSEMRFRE